MTPTQLLYHAAGEVFQCERISAQRCWLCGAETERGVAVKDRIKKTFTDIGYAQNPDGEYICDACAWSMNERGVKLAALVGKSKPSRMRNFSHFVKGGVWRPCSKAAKSQMADLLTHEALPELAVIALSGQKHLVFKSRANPPGAPSRMG